MSNPVHEERDTELIAVHSDESDIKRITKPLWVIAICSAVITVIAVLILSYAAYTAIAVNQAMNDFSEEWNSETTDTTPGEESDGANQEFPTDEPS